MTTQTFTAELVVVHCGQEGCNLEFGMPRHLYDRRREDHGDWYCPAGHCRHFIGKSPLQQAREEAKLAWEDAKYWQDLEAQRGHELETAQRRAAAARGQVTRIKRRVSKGVCPCCNRTFQDLGRHMAGQHPDWSGE